MAPHSTLNSWLEKLIYLVTGNFAKQGGMNLHTAITAISSGGRRQAQGEPGPG